MCDQIDFYDEQWKAEFINNQLTSGSLNINKETMNEFNDIQHFDHVYLGSSQKLMTFKQVEQDNHLDLQFCHFHPKLTQFLKSYFKFHNILPQTNSNYPWEWVNDNDVVSTLIPWSFVHHLPWCCELYAATGISLFEGPL